MKARPVVAVIYLLLMGLLLSADSINAAASCPVGDLNGDCRVDLQDLSLFMDQWLEGVTVPNRYMLVHWSMDSQTSGWVSDKSGNNHALELYNNASISPGGKINSALLLDGADDYARSEFVQNPADGPLSVVAWVKGGGPRQVIITQTDGSGTGREWLQVDAYDGVLISRLTDGYTILKSDKVITDGSWHHVGAVWDGQRRFLYVDGIQVASDTNPLTENLQASDGDMLVGAAKNFSTTMFWDGLIDDVRIYNRPLTALEVEAIASLPLSEPYSADFNSSDGVDMFDLEILARNWMIDPPGEYRCIWVDSWSYGFLNASQADDLINTCRENNINTVIVEIRKVGDAYYDSFIEPRATNISGGSGFDPLGYLLDIAHDTSGGKKYIEVHGWFVAQRIAKTGTLHPDHVLSLHPEYIMSSSTGETVSSNSLYMDPGHPGAVDWNVAVILDCLSRYDIDGINLDYIRYPGADWGYNPVSIERYNRFHNKTGMPSGLDWADWRRECITLQVKKIYVKSLMLDPEVVLTTDTINWGWGYDNFETSAPYASVYQDWVGWLRQGIIDYNTLMGYVCQSCECIGCPVPNPIRHQSWGNLSLANDDKRGSILSTGAYMQLNVQDAMDQLLWARDAGAAGLNIYDWGTEVLDNIEGQTRADFYRELKNQVFTEWANPPEHKWKTEPTVSIIQGNVTDSGLPVDHASVEILGLAGSKTYTDGSGWYAVMEVEPGDYIINFSDKEGSDVLMDISVSFPGEIVTVDADLGD